MAETKETVLVTLVKGISRVVPVTRYKSGGGEEVLNFHFDLGVPVSVPGEFKDYFGRCEDYQVDSTETSPEVPVESPAQVVASKPIPAGTADVKKGGN